MTLSGNPNVGKSTLFNSLTGSSQHTGNWAGVTVSCFKGSCSSKKYNYVFADLPGTYSLMAHSAEEALARDGICFGNCDAAVVICDSTCLERNLNLVLQILETGIPAMGQPHYAAFQPAIPTSHTVLRTRRSSHQAAGRELPPG